MGEILHLRPAFVDSYSLLVVLMERHKILRFF